jgi:hypothetical protein
MPEATPQTTPDVAPDAAAGTSQAGQAATAPAGAGGAAAGGTPNDPALMREDYTRKTMELAEQRRALEAERAAWERQRMQYQQPPQVYQQPYQPQVDPLADQFGAEGANAVKQVIGSAAQNVYQQLFQMEYAREEEKGQQKYGEAWKKFDYVDPTTGAKCNQVMDLRVKGLSIEQSWNALNPTDPAVIEQQIKDKIYAEMKQKNNATPASGSAPSPQGSGTGHAKTTAEAFNMAVAQLGGS